MEEVGYGTLERFLTVERGRPKQGTLILYSHVIPKDAAPVVVSDMRGNFLYQKKPFFGEARCGMFQCAPHSETIVVGTLFQRLLELNSEFGWPKIYPSIKVALGGLPAKSVVVSSSYLQGSGVSEEEAVDVMRRNGHIAVVKNVQVLLGNIPDGCALLATDDAGYCIRRGNFLGVILQGVDRNIAVVV